MDEPLNAPYFSQWQDPMWTKAILAGEDPCNDPLWRRSGFDDPEEYRYWAVRLCGIACLRSVLALKAQQVPTQLDLLGAALQRGVYRQKDDGTVLGMIYKPFCAWVEDDFDLTVTYFEHTALSNALKKCAQGQFLIMSVSPEIREPKLVDPPKGGHLVLVTSHDDQTVTFHNPSGIPPNHANTRLSLDDFDKFFSGRGIHIQNV
jgi:hypothetical protein